MRIFIQQTSGRHYWSHHDGWVETRASATAYNGVVAAVDAFIHDRIGTADILITFGAARYDTRLRMGS